jgi:hypothetical protein
MESKVGYYSLVPLLIVVYIKAEKEDSEKDGMHDKALFSSKIFYKMDTVAFSFVFDKYCPIMD